MALFEVVRELDPAAVAAARSLVAAAAAKGRPAIDAHRLDLATGGDAPDLRAALAWDDEHRQLRGYVQAVRGLAGWDVEAVTSVEASRDAASDRGPGDQLLHRLLRATLDAVETENDTGVRLWAYQAGPGDDRRAEQLGLHPVREVRQLRRPLPVDEPYALDTRPFVVGRDEAAWLEVNNRAFAFHPDQSGWMLADVHAREAEPWFDPHGFLLHEQDERLAGFCWTKVHRDTDPPLGEIYVIGVDPDVQGLGLGRSLVLAGLDHLARSGLSVGMLYVEADNLPALRLYEDMGFTVHHVDRVYSPSRS